ncbi:fibroblast growth factor 10a [Misgurnus anguillicaudatus]|uniref:fibroblast growth factor 10a n=1 Tax=Misgurnus anguillicaudatus TaxID=75329 RepID=UPI003CCFC5F1
MLTHSFRTRGEPDPARAAKEATAVFATDLWGFTSCHQPFSLPLLQHVLFCEAFPSPTSSSTMCRWKVTKGSSAWFHLSFFSLLLLLLVLCSSLPVACHDTHRAARDTNFSSPAVVGRHVRSYNHLTGDVRKRKLFSYKKFFLRIDKNGKVNGTKSKDDPYSTLEIKSVDVGIVAIKGIQSNYYLAINKKGVVYGARDFGIDCKLIERIEENRYNTYASAEWRNKKKPMFVGLSANGKPMRAKKTRRKNTATHFLPIPIM